MNLIIKILLCISCFSLSQAQEAHVIRAAIDIGSGGPKLRVAEVDLTLSKVKVLHMEQYPVIFYESIAQSRTLSPEIMLKGLVAIKNAIDLAKSHRAEGIVLMGTSVFRNAINGNEFASKILKETGLPVHILDQDLEGKLAFQSVLAKAGVDANHLIMWDIGGGSTQLVGMTQDGFYIIDGSNEGSGPFRDHIISSIQKKDLKDCKSPNPISSTHAHEAVEHASKLSTKVHPILKNKLYQSGTSLVGVGSVLGKGLFALMNKKDSFTTKELESVVDSLIGKKDDELGGGDYACIEVSNALLVLGFMKGLGIKQLSVIDVNNAEGAMIYKAFWK